MAAPRAQFGVKRMDSPDEARQKCPEIRLVHVEVLDEQGCKVNEGTVDQRTHKVHLAPPHLAGLTCAAGLACALSVRVLPSAVARCLRDGAHCFGGAGAARSRSRS